MFYTFEDAVRIFKAFRQMPREVSDELRGWRWMDYPLTPSSNVKLTVSDVVNEFCDSGRAVYLKYIMKIESKANWRINLGSLIHNIISEACRVAKLIVYLGSVEDGASFREEFENKFPKIIDKVMNKTEKESSEKILLILKRIWGYAANVFASAFDKQSSKSPYLSIDGLAALVVPMITEYPLDGSLIGLTKAIRVDALIPPNLIVEVKTRAYKECYEVGLAAYALSFESIYETPIDFALLVNLGFDKDFKSFKVYEKSVLISDELRQRFIERRDWLARIVEEEIDPGKAKKCDINCPFLYYCSSE